MRVRWSELSKESLANIYDFIFEDSPQNAEMVITSLIALGESLSNPKIEYSQDLIINDQRYRFIPKWSYKIIYERTVKEVIILDVFNVNQNPQKLEKLKS